MFAFSVNIACTKDGIRFSCSGGLGTGNITLRQNTAVDKEEDQVYYFLDLHFSDCLGYEIFSSNTYQNKMWTSFHHLISEFQIHR